MESLRSGSLNASKDVPVRDCDLPADVPTVAIGSPLIATARPPIGRDLPGRVVAGAA